MNDEQLRDMISETLTCRIDQRENCGDKMDQFLQRCFYHSGLYNSENDFGELDRKLKEKENYFGCFFALPIVITSMRWGVAVGQKIMVATTGLLFVLSGPVKALTYVLLHGILGFTMGSLWRLRVNWRLSIFLCTLVRAIRALGYVLTSSFHISENTLALITINVHASLTMIFNSLGFTTVPSMTTIYGIFGTLLLMNCCFFVFLLHILYVLFFTRLGMKSSLMMPRWTG